MNCWESFLKEGTLDQRHRNTDLPQQWHNRAIKLPSLNCTDSKISWRPEGAGALKRRDLVISITVNWSLDLTLCLHTDSTVNPNSKSSHCLIKSQLSALLYSLPAKPIRTKCQGSVLGRNARSLPHSKKYARHSPCAYRPANEAFRAASPSHMLIQQIFFRHTLWPV